MSAMTDAAPAVFRASWAERIMVTAFAVFMGALTLFLIIAAIGGFVAGFFLGVFLAAAAGLVLALTWLVAKEAVSRWRLYARIDGRELTAMLPRRRGFIDQPRDAVTIALADIDRIETRYESFTSIGVTTGQQAYLLVTRNGEHHLLGADREWVPTFFRKLAEEISSRAGAGIDDLGMVDGDAGFLLVTGQSVPDWGAPSLSAAEIATRQRRRARTGAVMGGAALLVILAQLLSRQ